MDWNTETPPSAEGTLAATIQKTNEHPAIQYQYRSHWDNRFNESTFADTVSMIYSKLDSSPLDKSATLQAYLDKKEFPFGGFAQESKMNEKFSMYSFPTFVLERV